MIPPTRQKEDIYSAQLLNREGIATIAFLGKYLARMGLIYSTRSRFGSSYFFLSCYKGLIRSTLRLAWPLPLNSSSILKIQVVT
jgi:hypothetical protein